MLKSFVYIFLFLFLSTKSFASPEGLINNSLVSLNKINSSKTQKEHLESYENISSTIDNIFSDYSTYDYSKNLKIFLNILNSSFILRKYHIQV